VGRLEDKSVLVVGGASGAGMATAIRYAAEGAAVTVADIDEPAAEAVVADIRASGGSAVAVGGDISEEDDARRFVTATVDAFGTVDVLHNIAYAYNLLASDRDLTELEADVIDRAFAVNAKGPMLTCKHTLPVMLERGHGVIINTASMAAVQADPGLTAYSASKAAVMSLTRTVATLYGRRGIRCNTLVPNFMLTARAKTFDAEYHRLKLSERLLDRLGTPDDFANVSVFLASDDSAYIQGQAILMDGGDLAHRPSVTVESWQALG